MLNREYPCDHYTSVINVTLLMTGCPRITIQSTAIQLLLLLDKRFFGTVRSLHPDGERGMFNNSGLCQTASVIYFISNIKMHSQNMFRE